jgi:hypothetical protein
MAGAPGIGKDTLLEPVKVSVGHWNWQEISTNALVGRFNGFAKAVILRISEVRDLGDIDRYAFYEHTKIYTAAPPDVLPIDEKNIREHSVPNVVGLIMTTNYALTGLYLPPDDRRHFVAASNVTRDSLPSDFFVKFWHWYEHGGYGHVGAYLRALDLSTFDPKGEPPKTTAFRALVMANAAPEESELSEIIELLKSPDVLTVQQLRDEATRRQRHTVLDFLSNHRTARQIPHRLGECGYDSIPNPGRPADGLWTINGRRTQVYGRRTLSRKEQIERARGLMTTGGRA